MNRVSYTVLPMELQTRLDRLRSILKQAAPSVIAVSGGVDSRFLAQAAWDVGCDALAVLFSGAHISPAEHTYALEWLDRSGHGYRVIPVDPLASAEVRANTRERCFFCKRLLFSHLTTLAAQTGRPCLFEGSNASDLLSFRPGLRALAELAVRTPLAEAGLRKPDIRMLARASGLEWPDQPSRPCLLTRFAYGLAPEPRLLARVSLAEDRLKDAGLVNFRLRVIGPAVLRLQLARSEEQRWNAYAPLVWAVLQDCGLVQVSVCWTEELSGYFDAPGAAMQWSVQGANSCTPVEGQVLGSCSMNAKSTLELAPKSQLVSSAN